MPYASTFPPLDIPDGVDLWTLLLDHKHRDFPVTKEILTCAETGRSHSWANIRSGSIEFGQGLRSLWGWKKGDVLAFYTPNSIDTPILTLGALWAGGVVSPANPLYTPDELAFQLRDSGAKALVTQSAYLSTALAAARLANLPADRILLVGPQQQKRPDDGDNDDDDDDDASTSPALPQHFTTLRAPTGKKQPRKRSVNPSTALSFLVYSSGTTGLPKGVGLTHRNMIANVLQAAFIEGRQWRDTPEVVQLGILPFFHIFGLTCGVLASIHHGWRLVVMPRFEMGAALRAIETHRVTFAYVPPPVVLAFSRHPAVEGADLGSLRVLHSGAAPLSRELTEKVWKRTGVPVKQGFGLSETGAVVCCQTVEEWEEFMGSVGKLVPGMEARIVGEDGEDVKEGEPGELWLKGPNVFPGYFNKPELTKAAFSPDGYFKTGDVFRRDEHGNFYCVDRLKELI
ncbi:hypothetical protein C8A05DRAFT_37450, partial [Staphylotrichum tortipilum]